MRNSSLCRVLGVDFTHKSNTENSRVAILPPPHTHTHTAHASACSACHLSPRGFSCWLVWACISHSSLWSSTVFCLMQILPAFFCSPFLFSCLPWEGKLPVLWGKQPLKDRLRDYLIPLHSFLHMNRSPYQWPLRASCDSHLL